MAANEYNPAQVRNLPEEQKQSLLKEQVLLENLGKIAYTLDKAYLSCLNEEYTVESLKELDMDSYYASRIRAISVKKCVINKEERIADCFKNIISLCGGIEHTLAVIFNRTVQKTEMLFVLKNPAENPYNETIQKNVELLEDSINGNFPGTEFGHFKYATDLIEALNFDKAESVSIMSGIPSEKSKEFISQGIEKLLNGIVPKNKEENYTVVLLAEPISADKIRNILNGYEELATAITPYAGYQFQSGNNETNTRGEMQSLSHGTNVSHSISKTHSINVGVNGGINGGVSVGLNAIIANVGAQLGGFLGLSLGYGYSWGKTDTHGTSDNVTTGTNTSESIGTSENTTYTYKSYTVSDILKKLESTIERIDKSKANGLWQSAVYVLSESPATTINVANYLRSIYQGDESYIEPSFVQTWIKNNDNPNDDFDQILNYISCFKHPVFKSKNDNIMLQPTLNVSTSELANILAFPRKSVTGLPVIECAEFGRNIVTYDKPMDGVSLPLGKIFHMNRPEETDVSLNKNSLASHTFITGSTGAGKSNTVYKMLKEAMSKGVKFLVVEPAKGEYKNVFGGREDVSVYGTNPALSDLLRINPFSFPSDIHVLEHLDRLIEIFNVCWPMYAAMPAVLKNAVEKSYEDCGWDLVDSVNEFNENLYPNFADVARNVKKIIDSSEYDTENKGAYKGSLLTRLNSLTNGINGLIFNEDEIGADELFDSNVIVDLSRVGSTETKSLIMGMLVLKLQEHRMASGNMNAELKHLTVLEEAHNLLKRTSTEQPTEGGNLLGKSVEMIANAIAEMRTYGEGFVIADQAPGLLDMAAIRNTNTKIIMRLPDQSDRELVGRAANLNGDQITELAKLPQGVAAIYQNEWIQPVLCKIDRFGNSDNKYNYTRPIKETEPDMSNERLKIAQLLSSGTAMSRENILKEISPILQEMKIACSVRATIFKLLLNPSKEPRMTRLAPIMSALFPKVRTAVEQAYSESYEPIEWTNAAANALQINLTEINNDFFRTIVQAVLTDYIYHKLGKTGEVIRWTKEGLIV